MPYPYSYTHEVDLGLWSPERALDAFETAAKADGLAVLGRTAGRIVLRLPAESVFGREGTAPTIVPLVLEVSVVGDGASPRLRARATFGACVALGAFIGGVPWLGAFFSAPRAALGGLPLLAACLALVWLLMYLLGMLGARAWVRRRLEGAVVR